METPAWDTNRILAEFFCVFARIYSQLQTTSEIRSLTTMNLETWNSFYVVLKISDVYDWLDHQSEFS